MTPLVAPAVALMNRLRYPQKFVLISLLFAVPLGLMMLFWLAEIEDRLAFARKERAGVEYIRGLRGLLEPLAVVQALGAGADADPALAMRLARERRRLAAAADVMDRIDAGLGERLRATDLWQSLRVRITHPSVHSATLTGETLQLIAHAGDSSNLISTPTSTATT